MPAAIVVLACAIGWVSPGLASASHNSKDCGVVSRGANDYRVRAMKLKCKVARKGSVKYLRSEEPRSRVRLRSDLRRQLLLPGSAEGLLGHPAVAR